MSFLHLDEKISEVCLKKNDEKNLPAGAYPFILFLSTSCLCRPESESDQDMGESNECADFVASQHTVPLPEYSYHCSHIFLSFFSRLLPVRLSVQLGISDRKGELGACSVLIGLWDRVSESTRSPVKGSVTRALT